MIPLVLLSILALCLGFLPAYVILPGFIARTLGDRLRALACGLEDRPRAGLRRRCRHVGFRGPHKPRKSGRYQSKYIYYPKRIDNGEHMKIRGTFTVVGIVQGVSYRETVLGLAKAQGLVGFVRNQKNGAVKVVTEGDEIVVKAFPQRLEIRSGRIQVEKVISRYSAAKGRFTRFRIVRGPNISDGELEIMERLDSGLVLMDRLGEKQDATRYDIKTMDSNIGVHFDKLDNKYDRFGSSLAQVAEDIHDIKGDLREDVVRRSRSKPA